jgi:imidazolonepropionase-like amidohydrolase
MLRVVLIATLLLLERLLPSIAEERRLAFVGATGIDGTGAPPIEDLVLLVRGERIAAIGRVSEVEIPRDAERVSASGRWIIPGLIDAHVHFFQSGGLYTRPDIIDLRAVRPYEVEIAAIGANIEATLARYLASGVTSVVDVGGPMGNFDVRALARRSPTAPRVAVAGPLLGRYAPPELSADDPPIIEIETREQARAEVRRQLAQGPDLIKIWFVFPEADLGPDLAWVRAAIEESHAAGVPVVAHATQLRVARAVVETGAEVLAHSIDDEPIDQALLDLMRERGVIYTTTLMVGPRYRAVFGRHLELSGIERRLGNPEVIQSLGELD